MSQPLQTFLLILLLTFLSLTPCSGQEIENCKNYNSINRTCSECYETHFLYNHDLMCIPCNDINLGDVGCEKNCIMHENDFLECDEDSCYDGYYNLEGICINCTYTSPNCTKCERKKIPGRENEGKLFKCLECKGEKDLVNYVSQIDGQCHRCKDFVTREWSGHCNKCKYKSNIENKIICLECEDGYYINLNETCTKCHNVRFTGGYCFMCTDEYPNKNNAEYCGCDEGYVQEKNDINCISCGENCNQCQLSSSNTTVCTKCAKDYSLYQGVCYPDYYCILGALRCFVFKILSCLPGYALLNNTCLPCEENCLSCSYNNQNEAVCSKCVGGYLLNNEKKCESCGSIKEIGGELCVSCKNSYGIYKCTECKKNISTLFEGRCILEVNIDYCKEVIKINTTNNEEKYSCIECYPNERYDYNEIYALVKGYEGVVICKEPEGILKDCREGTEDINGILNCTRCYSNYPFIYNNETNQTTCNSNCSYGAFNRKKYCYSCNDKNYGQVGCDENYGCTIYNSNYQINCEKCKEEYFEYTVGQCLPCDYPCKTCHFNETNQPKLICDSCYNNTHFLRNEQCIKLECKEYKDEITSGCIICNEFYDYYFNFSKCEKCSENFIKTIDETCIYCNARKNGGPLCKECSSETSPGSGIHCINCITDEKINAINNKNQCFNCKNELGEACEKCEFIFDGGNNQKLVCNECKKGYVLTSKKRCVSEISYRNVLYCLKYKNITENETNTTIPKLECEECKNGYYLNENGNCNELTLEKCSLKEVSNNKTRDLKNYCQKLCQIKNYAVIDNVLNGTINFNENDEIYLCLSNTGENKDKFTPKNLRKCSNAIYDINTRKYICTKCRKGYELTQNNECKQVIKLKIEIKPGLDNCQYSNGNGNEPFYSCENCTDKNDILAEIESGAKICVAQSEVSGCESVEVDTEYYKNVYNCTSCKKGSPYYALYYSSFFDRQICVTARDSLITKKDLSNFDFDSVEGAPKPEEGCSQLWFGIYDTCYRCDADKIGMEGCDGDCSFSEYREHTLKCESNKCKKDYLETSKGVCELCSTVNEGCIKCHYDESYPENYIGIKRKRRFVCEQCEMNYLMTNIDTCQHCSFFGFDNCEECIKDTENNDEIKCNKCKEGYFLNDDGYCIQCDGDQVKSANNKCIECDDIDQGGVEGCLKCNNNNDKIECTACNEGFILSSNDKKCIKISNYSILEEMANCIEINKTINDNYECVKCSEGYILLKENNEIRCVTPYFLRLTYKYDEKRCQEATNIKKVPANSIYTAEDQPFYSCIECLDNPNGKYYTLLKNKISGEVTCVNPSDYNELINCKTATVEKVGNKNVYNCEKCTNGNMKYYDKYTDSYICISSLKTCLIKNCRTCQKDNNYFCSVCALSGYVVGAGGYCEEKHEKPPLITWKDTFRYQLNQFKLTNDRSVFQSTFSMRGLTYSEIHNNHTFLVALLYLYKETSIYDRRNLEEKVEIEAICTLKKSSSESPDDVKLVEYDCTSSDDNEVDLTKYKLTDIENNNPSDVVKFTNFEEAMSQTDFDSIKKTKSDFTLGKLIKYVTFRIDDKSKKQKSNGDDFDITFDGTINRDVEILNKTINLEIVEIKNASMDCIFKTKENRKANLSCYYNTKKHKNIKSLTFKTYEVYDEKNPIYFTGIEEVELIKGPKKINVKAIIFYTCFAVAMVIIITGSILFYFYWIKKKKLMEIENEKRKKEIKNLTLPEKEIFDFDIKPKEAVIQKKEIKNILPPEKKTVASDEIPDIIISSKHKRSIRNFLPPINKNKIDLNTKSFTRNIKNTLQPIKNDELGLNNNRIIYNDNEPQPSNEKFTDKNIENNFINDE